MLRIGFTNKYFTLWDIQSHPQYNQDSHGHITLTQTWVIYTYLQNLSINEQEAIKKAQSKGCTNLEVDNELFGRNSSFNSMIKGYCELPKKTSSFFEFGKYRNEKIEECTDYNYLGWYYTETSNRYAKQVLLNNGWKMFDDMICTSERYDEFMKNKSEREAIEIVALKIEAINFIGVYQLDNEDKFLYATDDDGNPRRKSCFKLID